jgi:hypothetical protein
MPLALIGTFKSCSPGATTAAAGLAAAWPEDDRMLLEADPSGGVLAARWRLRPRPGLVEVTTRLSSSESALESGSQEAKHLGAVFPVVCAPAQPLQASRAVEALCERGTGVLAAPGQWVLADVGRIGPELSTWGLLKVADAVVIVVPGTVAGVLALHAMAPALIEQCGTRLAALVAPAEYGADEVNGTLMAPGLDVAMIGETPTAGRRRSRDLRGPWGDIAARMVDLAGRTPTLAITEDGELSEVVR